MRVTPLEPMYPLCRPNYAKLTRSHVLANIEPATAVRTVTLPKYVVECLHVQTWARSGSKLNINPCDVGSNIWREITASKGVKCRLERFCSKLFIVSLNMLRPI